MIYFSFQSQAATKVRSVINLKGSTAIVTEFFGFCINSILYQVCFYIISLYALFYINIFIYDCLEFQIQRGIYPPDKFQTVTKYGLPIHITNDTGLKNYLGQVLSQVSEWLMNGSIQRFVIVIAAEGSGEVLERWVFNVESDKSMMSSGTFALFFFN